MKVFINFIFAILLAFSAAAQQPEYGNVKSVHDGDSYRVQLIEVSSVRLIGVDCPEVYAPGYVSATQPYGRLIADSVRLLLKGVTVTPEIYGYDQYGRVLAALNIQGQDLGLYLITKGWAWYVPQKKTATAKTLSFKDRRRYKAAEATAKAQKVGLWAGHLDEKNNLEQPMSPSKWRATHK